MRREQEKKKLFSPECKFATTFSFALFWYYQGFPHRFSSNFLGFFIMNIDFLIFLQQGTGVQTIRTIILDYIKL